MNITIEGEALDMQENFSIDIEESSAIYSDNGPQSLPVSVPMSPRNKRIFRYPGRIDTASDPNKPRRMATVSDGAWRKTGLLNIIDAGSSGINFNIGFDNSTAYSEWKDRKLSELRDLPVIMTTTKALMDELAYYYYDGQPWDEFAVFPVALSKAITDEDTLQVRTWWEMVNVPGSDNTMEQPEKVMRIIDNTPTEVTIPPGYGLTPFLPVYRILDLIFQDLGYDIAENPFADRDRLDLMRLVVLNNAADAICTGTLRYSELMPDCTVEEFLQALWVRFGLTFRIDSDSKKAYLRLLDDIIKAPASMALDGYIGKPDIDVTYNSPRYVTLSAGTSIDGAAPACERWEDYIKGLSLLEIHVGPDVSLWKPHGSGWQGPVGERPDIDPNYPDGRDPDEIPDPWDDWDRDFWEEDGRDYDYYAARAAGVPMPFSAGESDRNTWLGRETVTGKWWKLDRINDKKRESSSGFFKWDPKSEGLEAMDLVSSDECVPIEKISIGATGTANMFNGYAPAYLVGARHYNTYIKGNDTDEDGDRTPLAFVWAYHTGDGTVGRLCPEDRDGSDLYIDDGGPAGSSLYFQFADGLFAKYWSKYDEYLRHGSRKLEVTIRLPKKLLRGIDILQPVMLHGCRCLIEKMEYRLPSAGEVEVDMTLQTISPLGRYNIAKEQGIPAVAMTALGLGWAFMEGDWQAAEDAKRPALDQQALMRFRQELRHLTWSGEKEEIIIDPLGVVATSDWVEEMPTTLPPDIPTEAPGTKKYVTFRGRIYYACRLVRRIFDPETGATIAKEITGDIVARTFVDYTFDAVYISTYLVRQ